MAWKSSFRQNYWTTFSPTVPPSAAGISHVVADVEAPGGEKWEHLKSGGKQWQATPKNVPRMQRTSRIVMTQISFSPNQIQTATPCCHEYALSCGYIGAKTDTTQQTNICLGIHSQIRVATFISDMSVQTYSYYSYTITEPVGLLALSFHFSTTLWNICYV